LFLGREKLDTQSVTPSEEKLDIKFDTQTVITEQTYVSDEFALLRKLSDWLEIFESGKQEEKFNGMIKEEWKEVAWGKGLPRPVFRRCWMTLGVILTTLILTRTSLVTMKMTHQLRMTLLDVVHASLILQRRNDLRPGNKTVDIRRAQLPKMEARKWNRRNDNS
jgi:hypothetical protein